ncbi:Proepiregulin Epiregulin [Channa argus]|uniref:Proepiregulin Epiregulin n=1 Tax=Channa argus TaxID=215402 RepID=A0A6G1PZ61_CHAAH|nr:Proepiregulin Epiregulin [Channa argus]
MQTDAFCTWSLDQRPVDSEMGTNSKPSALLSLLGFMLLWPHVLTKSVSFTLETADWASLSTGQAEERRHVEKRTIQNCDSTFDEYCLNNGKCMLLLDISEHHCKCEEGYYGHRCDNVELVRQPMGEKQIIITVFFVCLLIIGLAGILYFFCKWYKKNRFPCQQKRQGYRGVQTV